MIDFVNSFDFLRAANEVKQVAIACAFPLFQVLAHCRPNCVVHQCGFAAAGDSRDHRKPADGETNIDVFQVVRARTVTSIQFSTSRSDRRDPRIGWQSGVLRQRAVLGIRIRFDITQGSADYDSPPWISGRAAQDR